MTSITITCAPGVFAIPIFPFIETVLGKDLVAHLAFFGVLGHYTI